jgi:hypothetical protein
MTRLPSVNGGTRILAGNRYIMLKNQDNLDDRSG